MRHLTCMVLLLLTAGPILAAPVEFRFSGNISEVWELSGVSPVRVGDPFTVTFALESTAADPYAGPQFAAYPLIAPSVLDLPGFHVAGSFRGDLEIQLPYPGSSVAGRVGFGSAVFPVVTKWAVLLDDPQPPLPNDAFPMFLPEFSSRRLVVTNTSPSSFNLTGEVTAISITPEPTSLLLFCVGAVVARRHHRDQINVVRACV